MSALDRDPTSSPIARRELDEFSIAAVQSIKGTTTVSVCMPARNEATTVGTIVAAIEALFRGTGIVDELIVFDDGSTDDTALVAAAAGARVIAVADVLPEHAGGSGKGNVLWKSVAASTGDIVVWIDADLTSFTPEWILGLIGPLLEQPDIALVKADDYSPACRFTNSSASSTTSQEPLWPSEAFPHSPQLKSRRICNLPQRRSKSRLRRPTSLGGVRQRVSRKTMGLSRAT